MILEFKTFDHTLVCIETEMIVNFVQGAHPGQTYIQTVRDTWIVDEPYTSVKKRISSVSIAGQERLPLET